MTWSVDSGDWNRLDCLNFSFKNHDIDSYINKYFAAVINHARLIFPTIVHAYESLNISRKLLECQVMPKYGHSSALRTFIWTNQR